MLTGIRHCCPGCHVPGEHVTENRTITKTVITFPGQYFEIGNWVWGCIGKSYTCFVIVSSTRKNPKDAQRYELLPESGNTIEVELDPDGQSIQASFQKISVDESGQYPVFYGE